jgi:type II secretory pathway component PulK
VTPDIFYGKTPEETEEENVPSETVGLKGVFSIYAAGEQVDINSAAFPVLKVVLGIPAGAARQILTAREEKVFENEQDLIRRVPEMAAFIGGIRGNIVYRSATPYYTVEAKAKAKTGGGGRSLQTVLKIDSREKQGYKFVQWVDAVY